MLHAVLSAVGKGADRALDLSYNVIKRVKRKKKIEYVMESQILKGMYEIYREIEKELKEQDRLYSPVNNQIKYGEIFTKNPYVRMIYQLYKNSMDSEKEKNIRRQIESLVGNLIYNTYISDNRGLDMPEN